MRRAHVIKLRAKDRGALERIVARASNAAGLVRRARVVKNPKVRFQYTPTSASWLNQVEGFFGILGKQSLSLTDLSSKKALREHIGAYMRSWKRSPTPFAWTKPAEAIIRSHRRMLDRISTAVR